MAGRVDPYKNFRFLVEIDGVVQAGFSDCSGYGSHVEAIEYREGGDANTVRKLPGKVTYPDITLKWGLTDSRELYDWHLAAVSGQIQRKNGSVIVLDDAGRLFGVVSADTGLSILVEISPRTGVAKTIGPMGVGGIMALAAQGTVTDAERTSGSPLEFGLLQNYPNPFNPATQIRYEVLRTSHVRLVVYDLLGREVAVLVNEQKLPGYHQIQWNTTVPSGIYFYRLQAGGFVETKKLVLLR